MTRPRATAIGLGGSEALADDRHPPREDARAHDDGELAESLASAGSTRRDEEPESPAPDVPVCLFYSEAEAAFLLGIHRTTLRALALDGHAPVEPIRLTEHRRVYRRIDIHRLAGIDP